MTSATGAAGRATITHDLDNRERISRFVRDFYRDVAQDDLLGPIFADAHVDWPSHLDKLTDFWAWQLLGEPGYEGNPLRAHEPIDAATPFTDEHFDAMARSLHRDRRLALQGAARGAGETPGGAHGTCAVPALARRLGAW